MKRYLTWLGILAVTAFVSMGTIVTPEVVLVDPTADLQDAIDNAPAGSVVQLGVGEFVVADTNGIIITKAITIRGSGQGRSSDGLGGTVIRPYGNNESGAKGIVIRGTVEQVNIENLTIGLAAAPDSFGTGYGIWLDMEGEALATQTLVHLRNLSVWNMGGHGIFADGASSLGLVACTMEYVRIASCNGDGLRCEGGTGVRFIGIYPGNNGRCGMYLLNSSNPTVRDGWFEYNCNSYGSLQYIGVGAMVLTNCNGGTITNNTFEEFQHNENAQRAIELIGCRSVVVEGNHFMNSTCNSVPGLDAATSVTLTLQTRGCRVGPNTHRNVVYSVDSPDDDGNQGIIIEPQAILETDGDCAGLMRTPKTVFQNNPVTSTDEGVYNVVYVGPTALAGDDGGYRIVGIGFPLSAGDDLSDIDRPGTLTYDYHSKQFIFFNGTSWDTLQVKEAP